MSDKPKKPLEKGFVAGEVAKIEGRVSPNLSQTVSNKPINEQTEAPPVMGLGKTPDSQPQVGNLVNNDTPVAAIVGQSINSAAHVGQMPDVSPAQQEGIVHKDTQEPQLSKLSEGTRIQGETGTFNPEEQPSSLKGLQGETTPPTYAQVDSSTLEGVTGNFNPDGQTRPSSPEGVQGETTSPTYAQMGPTTEEVTRNFNLEGQSMAETTPPIYGHPHIGEGTENTFSEGLTGPYPPEGEYKETNSLKPTLVETGPEPTIAETAPKGDENVVIMETSNKEDTKKKDDATKKAQQDAEAEAAAEAAKKKGPEPTPTEKNVEGKGEKTKNKDYKLGQVAIGAASPLSDPWAKAMMKIFGMMMLEITEPGSKVSVSKAIVGLVERFANSIKEKNNNRKSPSQQPSEEQTSTLSKGTDTPTGQSTLTEVPKETTADITSRYKVSIAQGKPTPTTTQELTEPEPTIPKGPR